MLQVIQTNKFTTVRKITRQEASTLVRELIEDEENAQLDLLMIRSDKFRLAIYEDVQTIVFIDRDEHKGFSEDYYILKKDDVILEIQEKITAS